MQRSHSRLVTVTPNQDVQTSERLLIAAEKLFAEQGVGTVSLRKIMTQANANVASIHYYFGSKEKVLEAIFEKHGAELNSERHRLLDAYERKPGRGFRALQQLIYAFMGPAIRLRETERGILFERITTACSVDPDLTVQQIVRRTFEEVGQRFSRLLREACPHLSDTTFYWRLHCAFGSMVYVCHDNSLADCLGLNVRSASSEAILEQLVSFVATGMQVVGTESEDAIT